MSVNNGDTGLDLATASIEQIEAHAMKQMEDADKSASPDAQQSEQVDKAATGKSDVPEASSSQPENTEQEATAPKRDNDAETNFAKLRTKLKATEEELAAIKAENERIAAEKAAPPKVDQAELRAGIDKQLAEIGSKFESGDLTWEEYQTQLRETGAQWESIVKEAAKVEAIESARQQREQDAQQASVEAWAKLVETFKQSHPDGISYDTDDAKSSQLNTYVKALASDPDNNDKPMEWFLDTAHDLVKAKNGVATTAKPNDPPAAKQKVNAPFNTLSEVPGGIPPARSEAENLEMVSGAALTNRFLSDPSQIDKVLASLG